MEPQSAFEELGILPGTPYKDIRRAYLRLLKTRKPEVDPEGFLRLRAAFEALQSLCAGQDAQGGEDGAPAEHAAESYGASLLDQGAVATGDHLSGCPDSAPPPELLLAAASASLARGLPLEASRDLRKFFDSGPAEVVPAGLVLAVVLALEEHGAVVEGAALFHIAENRFASFVETATNDRQELGPVWLVVSELVAIDEEFPAALRAAIAGAIRAGRLAAAEGELRRFAREDPQAADRAGQLIADLRILRGAYHQILSPLPALVTRRSRVTASGVWYGLMACVLLVRAVAFLGPDDSRPLPPAAPAAPAGPASAASAPGLAAARPPAVSPRVLYDGSCGTPAAGVAATQPCRLAWIVLADLEQGRCAEARETLAKLEPAIAGRAAARPGFPALAAALGQALPACVHALAAPPVFSRVCGAAAASPEVCATSAALIAAARGGDCRQASVLWAQVNGASLAGRLGKQTVDFLRLRPELFDLLRACR
jgi:hypothetical protein